VFRPEQGKRLKRKANEKGGNMKCFEAFLIGLLFFSASWAWSAEIHDAALAGDLAKVKAILAADPAQLNARGRSDKAPIHWAAQGGQLAVVKLLLAMGAAVDEANVQKETALVYAAEGGHLQLAELLISRGADVNVRTELRASPIHYALWAGRTEMVRLLVRRGADIAWERGSGFTLLHEAANQANPELVAFLLEKGLAVDARNRIGATPLHYAALHGTPETAQLLVRHGADVNLVSQNGWTPLGLAASRGEERMAALLLKAGARTAAADPASGRTALHEAAARGYGKVCALLAAGGAEVNSRDALGRTPLDYAARYRHPAIAAALRGLGAVGADEPGPAATNWLQATLADGQAVVWYLGHSGWAVRTRRHLLVFDYWKPSPLADEPSLDNGAVNPAELKDLDVTVFVSHDHRDHYMPETFAWRTAIPRVRFVTGFAPEKQQDCLLLANRQKRELDGLEIIPIESNDGGQGYFVRVDGVAVFHPGDHANRQRDFSGPYKQEIDFLADQGLKADILFAPVSGCGFGDIVSVKRGVYYAMDRLAARSVFPMHAGGAESRYRDFAREAKNAGYDVPFCLADLAGDHFIVTPERVRDAFAAQASCAKNAADGCVN
jgi:ankyrin repeat protein/L-ascorbate metabolism protein UlaG (beta-lactamase superfamily)